MKLLWGRNMCGRNTRCKQGRPQCMKRRGLQSLAASRVSEGDVAASIAAAGVAAAATGCIDADTATLKQDAIGAPARCAALQPHTHISTSPLSIGTCVHCRQAASDTRSVPAQLNWALRSRTLPRDCSSSAYPQVHGQALVWVENGLLQLLWDVQNLHCLLDEGEASRSACC